MNYLPKYKLHLEYKFHCNNYLILFMIFTSIHFNKFVKTKNFFNIDEQIICYRKKFYRKSCYRKIYSLLYFVQLLLKLRFLIFCFSLELIMYKKYSKIFERVYIVSGINTFISGFSHYPRFQPLFQRRTFSF